MTDEISKILETLDPTDRQAASQLIPHLYEELKILAASKMAQENPGQTLTSTALVHEAYMRITKDGDSQKWDSRGHFFAAAAEAMRRILIENARRKKRVKHGGNFQRIDLDPEHKVDPTKTWESEILELDEALGELEKHHVEAASIVKLRYFAGMTVVDAAESLGIAKRTAQRHWTFAKAFILDYLKQKLE